MQEVTNIQHFPQAKSPATSDKKSRDRRSTSDKTPRAKSFVMLPKAYTTRSDVTANNQVAMTIHKSDSGLSGIVWKRYERVAEEHGLRDKESVRNLMRAVRDKGDLFIFTQKNHPRANCFRVSYDEVPEAIYLLDNPSDRLRQVMRPHEFSLMKEQLLKFFSPEGPGRCVDEVNQEYEDRLIELEAKRAQKRAEKGYPMMPQAQFISNNNIAPTTPASTPSVRGESYRSEGVKITAPYSNTSPTQTNVIITSPLTARATTPPKKPKKMQEGTSQDEDVIRRILREKGHSQDEIEDMISFSRGPWFQKRLRADWHDEKSKIDYPAAKLSSLYRSDKFDFPSREKPKSDDFTEQNKTIAKAFVGANDRSLPWHAGEQSIGAASGQYAWSIPYSLHPSEFLSKLEQRVNKYGLKYPKNFGELAKNVDVPEAMEPKEVDDYSENVEANKQIIRALRDDFAKHNRRIPGMKANAYGIGFGDVFLDYRLRPDAFEARLKDHLRQGGLAQMPWEQKRESKSTDSLIGDLASSMRVQND